MKSAIDKYPRLMEALENNKIAYVFGTGLSSSLTGKPYSWYRWIKDGIEDLENKSSTTELNKQQIQVHWMNY